MQASVPIIGSVGPREPRWPRRCAWRVVAGASNRDWKRPRARRDWISMKDGAGRPGIDTSRWPCWRMPCWSSCERRKKNGKRRRAHRVECRRAAPLAPGAARARGTTPQASVVVTLPTHAPGSGQTLPSSPPGSSGAASCLDQPASHPRAGPARLERSSLEAVTAAFATAEAADWASRARSSPDRGGHLMEDPDRVLLARDARALRTLVHARQSLPYLA